MTAVLLNPVQVTVGMLVDSVPRDAVDDAIAACGVRERRSDGKLPAYVTTLLTLGLALFPDDDYTDYSGCGIMPTRRGDRWRGGVSLPGRSA